MISPKCFICHATFKHKRTFHLLEFKKEKEQETFLPDKVGYTPNFVWFCNCHFKYGEKYCEYAFTNVIGKQTHLTRNLEWTSTVSGAVSGFCLAAFWNEYMSQ